MLSLFFTFLKAYKPVTFDILSTNVNAVPVETLYYSSADDPKLRNDLTSFVGAETADKFVNRIRYSKTSGAKYFTFKSTLKTDQIHIYDNICTVLNMNRQNDGRIALRKSIVTTNCEVLSRYNPLRRMIVNKWRPLTKNQIDTVYNTMKSASDPTLNEITAQVRF